MKKTAVIEQEFDSIQNQITTVHSENVRQIHAALIEEIRSLADLMEAAYSAHEYIIRSFRTAVENYDDCR